MTNIGFIGMGNMAQAIAGGFIKSGRVKGTNLFAYAPNQEKLKANASKIGFKAESSIEEMISKCDTVIVACKPYQIKDVLGEKGSKVRRALKGKALVSVAAGWVHSTFHDILGNDVRIQCIMPNTPVAVSEGMILYCCSPEVTPVQIESFLIAMRYAGRFLEIDEHLMDAGMAISGCGPAYVDLFVEAMADAGVAAGLPRKDAVAMAAQMVLGSAKLILESGKHPGELKDAVCSPGGTTIQGVRKLEEKGFRSAVMEAVLAAYNA